MSVFSKRSLIVGIAVLVIGGGACAAVWGGRKFMKRSTSIKSQVTAYLLDDRGEIGGLLLASGDQLQVTNAVLLPEPSVRRKGALNWPIRAHSFSTKWEN